MLLNKLTIFKSAFFETEIFFLKDKDLRWRGKLAIFELIYDYLVLLWALI
jgi:hypothetical protein